MKNILVYPVGCTQALEYAQFYLHKNRIPLVDHPSPEITHLLLDVPSFDTDGNLRCGSDPERVLERLPCNITIIGGNLQHPTLSGYRTVDLLQDPQYLARNARITAECALQVAMPQMKSIFPDTSALVIGWGRIGKCLGQLLLHLGCKVTVAARSNEDLAMLKTLGYQAVSTSELNSRILEWPLVFNTVPYPIIRDPSGDKIDRLWIDLASQKGLDAEGVIWAKGLPGTYAPESSGKLIAETVLRYL